MVSNSATRVTLTALAREGLRKLGLGKAAMDNNMSKCDQESSVNAQVTRVANTEEERRAISSTVQQREALKEWLNAQKARAQVRAVEVRHRPPCAGLPAEMSVRGEGRLHAAPLHGGEGCAYGARQAKNASMVHSVMSIPANMCCAEDWKMRQMIVQHPLRQNTSLTCKRTWRELVIIGGVISLQ